jgi:dihydrofolate synthase/folylpolyglutamate synthase
MPVDELAQLAADIFGEDRVTVALNLPAAIQAAVAIAEDDSSGELSGVAVLVTGSIVTVADARKLLKK